MATQEHAMSAETDAPGRLYAEAEGGEQATLDGLAQRARPIWRCPRQHPGKPDFDCGWQNRKDEAACGGCGKPRPELAGCKHCGRQVYSDGRVWIDDTHGDVCGWNGGNEPHEPAAGPPTSRREGA
jgi:hypothetical protein